VLQAVGTGGPESGTMGSHDEAKRLFDAFKATFNSERPDMDKCEQQLAQLKLMVFSSGPGVLSGGGAAKEQQLVREMLEIACFLSIRRKDTQGFERHVTQLKMYYSDQHGSNAEGQKLLILGLFILHLLSADRLGEFHTELELIPVDDYENPLINQPILLERCLMEGNYAKILEAQKDVPHAYYSFFMERLIDTVRLKVGTSLERSYEHLPTKEAAAMLMLADVPALQAFAAKENERKAREESDDSMGDFTPSLTRRAPVGLVRWEVGNDGKLYFKRTAQKQLEIPALDLMVNTIGYATDLERIV